MKGLVFTEFVRHVEDRYGADMVDDIIDAARLPHDGAYTSVGSYPFSELISLVTALAEATGAQIPAILDAFGTDCFRCWVTYAPQVFSPSRRLFDMLADVNHVHETEVRKLYPDAEFPWFVIEDRSETRLVLGYYSSKPLSAVAVGAIKGAAAHAGQLAEVSSEPVEGSNGRYTRIFVNLIPG